ncbi:PhzF family phenazine biosynthesis protein [Neisseria perflava]|uniref:PhzF family phenazine biosynthesis protein n=1 Tax=Neisseria perflava TaxID=33053 RepID=UPI0020A1189E|nr:PhzF family phenazine biosynthesis protein [Neisseria perflava]MCP1659702.1 putative PhzF superfamily epimerase YddE/YHI9 [Neisseria perflava]MCP1771278.1 putative PhzF superfamily epimerase YddE/YHI9 [Neisseria perflava]
MIRQYVVDAFSDKLFGGNPAAVCILDGWPSEKLMQNIAVENNLSETAFAVKEGADYRLRWFTPGGEIDLCGHATLATAHVIMSETDKGLAQVSFHTLSGVLTVVKNGSRYEMDFPAYALEPVAVTPEICAAAGAVPSEAYLGRDLLCVFDDEDTVRRLAPDGEKLQTLDGLLFHATAKGRDTDYVSRSFGPKLGVAEDPVCGSGHCHIVPYWAQRLAQNEILAYQASARGGMLYCRLQNGCVVLGGEAVTFSESLLRIEP